MKKEEYLEQLKIEGKYCYKGVPNCFCKSGFPYEEMCVDCRQDRHPSDIYSYCVCPPKDFV